MQSAITTLCLCWLSLAYASLHQGGLEYQLYGVPDIESYGKLQYPKYDLLELGNIVHGELSPKTIKVLKTISYKVPQPYPVKVPYKVPYPVHVEKPFPVVETKFIKVPHPVPFPVYKQVPVPLEVPKPYPVPAEEYKPPAQEAAAHGWAGASSFGGSYQGGGELQGGLEHLQSYGVPGQEAGVPLGAADYQSSFGGAEEQSQDFGSQEEEGHGLEDRSSSYAVADNQEQKSEEEEQH